MSFDFGIIFCEHQDQDILVFKVEGVPQSKVPRCLECGQIKSDDGQWRGLALFVLYFLYSGDEDGARRTIELMEEGRRQFQIPYPLNTMEEYKAQLEEMRPELEKIKKERLH